VPTYQYACTSCGEQIEAVQRFTDDPLTVCPACGGGLRKVFSPVGIVFKGSGFYRTDSRKSVVPGADKESKPAANGSGDSPAPADKAGKADKADKKASPGNGSPPAAAKPAGQKPSQPAGAGSAS
jgi:putative FmdB family regulatory protein